MLVARAGGARAAAALAAAERARPSYDELGAALRDELPGGYHHLRSAEVVGHTDEAFALAREGLRAWRAHSVPGMHVLPRGIGPHVGATVLVAFGLPWCSIAAPCRVVGVVDEADRFAFAYGTLPGHPERGEECFELRRGPRGEVVFEVRAFSTGATALARAVGPLGRWLQGAAARAYLRALRAHVAGGAISR